MFAVCNKGGLMITKEQKEKEPKLEDCSKNRDVCFSVYARTNITYEDTTTALTGSWEKTCHESGRIADIKELFVEDLSDQCVEQEGPITIAVLGPMRYFCPKIVWL